jgi:MurNAc alpha-1-phosphate uridylyltransferase
MVLAAGLGTRMRPHNGQVPKPLVTVAGKALIDYVLDRLADTGVERAVVNVHYLADQIEQHWRRASILGSSCPTSAPSCSAPAAA